MLSRLCKNARQIPAKSHGLFPFKLNKVFPPQLSTVPFQKAQILGQSPHVRSFGHQVLDSKDFNDSNPTMLFFLHPREVAYCGRTGLQVSLDSPCLIDGCGAASVFLKEIFSIPHFSLPLDPLELIALYTSVLKAYHYHINLDFHTYLSKSLPQIIPPRKAHSTLSLLPKRGSSSYLSWHFPLPKFQQL